jgi:DNA-binding transcriptional LysR family regulator
MQSEWLSLCLALAQNRSLSDTAKQFEISSQSLARKIHHLEVELGVTLFSRVSSHWVLTPAGEHFLKEAPDLLQTLYEIEHLSLSFDQQAFSIAWSGSWGIHLLPPILKDFSETFSRQISSHHLPFQDMFQLLHAQRIHLYLGTYAIDQAIVIERELITSFEHLSILVGAASPFVIVGRPRSSVKWCDLEYVSLENLSFNTSVWNEKKHPRYISVSGAISVSDAISFCLNSDCALYLPQILVQKDLNAGGLSILCTVPEMHTITPAFVLNTRLLADDTLSVRNLLYRHGFESLCD